jgi:hypothetical protein
MLIERSQVLKRTHAIAANTKLAINGSTFIWNQGSWEKVRLVIVESIIW